MHAAVDLVVFLMCVTRRSRVVKGGRRVNFCMGEDSCSSQTTKELGSESTLLIAIYTLRSPFVPQTEC